MYLDACVRRAQVESPPVSVSYEEPYFAYPERAG